MPTSGAALVVEPKASERDQQVERIRQRKRLHEAVRNGYEPRSTLASMTNLRDMGYTLAEIATALNSQGYKAPLGGDFFPNTVRRLLDDPII